jgi:DNA replication protein DnaC
MRKTEVMMTTCENLWQADDHQANRTEELLKKLRLPTARRCFSELHDQAPSKGWSPMQWLTAILEHEVCERDDRRRTARRKESGLPPGKTLETFDFELVKGVKKMKAQEFAKGDWVEDAHNLLLFGPSGSGKTHLAAAIAYGLIDHGRRVLYTPTTTMLQRLQAARKEATLPKLFEKLERFDVIILDDIGYADKRQVDTGLLFDLIADRYESRSLIVASNKPFSAWEDVFPDKARCVAAIDRLVHYGVTVEIQGESYRRKKAQERI